MSKYTATLQEIIEKGYPIWRDSFETTVASYVDTVFTADKWQLLKDYFLKKNYYNEIGFETLDYYYHYTELKFIEIINKYKKIWTAYNQEIASIYNNISESENQNVYEDLPQTAGALISSFATNRNNNNASFKGATAEQIELLNSYVDKVRDVDWQFVKEFDSCFMGVY